MARMAGDEDSNEVIGPWIFRLDFRFLDLVSGIYFSKTPKIQSKNEKSAEKRYIFRLEKDFV